MEKGHCQQQCEQIAHKPRDSLEVARRSAIPTLSRAHMIEKSQLIGIADSFTRDENIVKIKLTNPLIYSIIMESNS
jgi:hypothetical protein